MKKIGKILVVLISLLLCSSECEEVEELFNYIVVTVNVHAYSKWTFDEPAKAQPINICVQKAGGEKVEERLVTNNDGYTSLTAVFNLYKEQPIEASACLFLFPECCDYASITWEDVSMRAQKPTDKGPETYTWNVSLFCIMSEAES
jgi:hypothetical protein